MLLLHVGNTANTIDLQRQIIKNLSAVLEASGSSLADVAKVNVFLADMKDFQDMNEVYMEGFPEPRPVCFDAWTPQDHIAFCSRFALENLAYPLS